MVDLGTVVMSLVKRGFEVEFNSTDPRYFDVRLKRGECASRCFLDEEQKVFAVSGYIIRDTVRKSFYNLFDLRYDEKEWVEVHD